MKEKTIEQIIEQTIRYNDYEVGANIPELHIGKISQVQLARYAGASGDFNPIHVDPDFARSVGLENSIAHGMFIMAQLGRLATNWVSPKQIVSLHTKFKNMTQVGENIVCQGKVKKKKEEELNKYLLVSLTAINQNTQEIKAVADLLVLCK